MKRVTERPKRYVVDCGLVGSALAADRAAVLRDGTLLGRLVDTLVFGQLRNELAASPSPRGRLRHLRTEAGRHEIDLAIDLGPRGLIAIEVSL